MPIQISCSCGKRINVTRVDDWDDIEDYSDDVREERGEMRRTRKQPAADRHKLKKGIFVGATVGIVAVSSLLVFDVTRPDIFEPPVKMQPAE